MKFVVEEVPHIARELNPEESPLKLLLHLADGFEKPIEERLAKDVNELCLELLD
jgi:hypothetical protein